MEDKDIIDLYWQRNERAVELTQSRYGGYCQRIAIRILSAEEDARECVNDTLLTAWNRIPPAVPVSLKAFLGKIVRDHAINRYRHDRTQKRYAGITVMLNELEECIPDGNDPQRTVEERELTHCLERWLATLPEDKMALFVKRYYYGESVKELARQQRCTENQMAQILFRLRQELKQRFSVKGEIK